MPRDPQVAETLGWIYSQKGVYQPARDELRPAARALPNNALMHFHLGMTYMRAGEVVQARQTLRNL